MSYARDSARVCEDLAASADLSLQQRRSVRYLKVEASKYQFKFDESMAESYADIVLCTALDIGEHLLKNGAEVSRVEDTIERICFAYGAAHV